FKNKAASRPPTTALIGSGRRPLQSRKHYKTKTAQVQPNFSFLECTRPVLADMLIYCRIPRPGYPGPLRRVAPTGQKNDAGRSPAGGPVAI
ncbi:MAG: hypothetical protein ACOX7W_02260, partial [Christensenellales bacterium]